MFITFIDSNSITTCPYVIMAHVQVRVQVRVRVAWEVHTAMTTTATLDHHFLHPKHRIQGR